MFFTSWGVYSFLFYVGMLGMEMLKSYSLTAKKCADIRKRRVSWHSFTNIVL